MAEKKVEVEEKLVVEEKMEETTVVSEEVHRQQLLGWKSPNIYDIYEPFMDHLWI